MSALQQIEGILQAMFLPDNQQRKQAEAAIHHHLGNPQSRETFVDALSTLLIQSKNTAVRNLCAVYLRTRLPHGEPMLWDKLPEALQEKIKAQLLQAVVREPVDSQRKQVADTVTALAEILIYRNKWPQLFPFIQQLGEQEGANMRFIAFFILGKLGEEIPDQLDKVLNEVRLILAKGLSDRDSMVRLAAMMTAASIVINMENDQQFLLYRQQLLAGMLSVAKDSLMSKQMALAARALKTLGELALHVATFIEPFLEPVSNMMFTVANDPTFEKGLRLQCVQFFQGVAHNKPQLLRANPKILKLSLTLCMNLMLRLQDSPNWATQEERGMMFLEETMMEDDEFSSGEHCLDRLAQWVGCEHVLAQVGPMILQAWTSPDWKFRHAGLRALAQVGEVMQYSKLPIKQVVEFLRDPHPRVRHAALHCLGQLCTDFDGQLQQDWHEHCLPPVLEVLKNGRFPRVQCHAAACIVNFMEDIEDSIVQPYLDVLLPLLVNLMQNGSRQVREQCLTAMAAVATSSKAHFIRFYPQIVPLVKNICVHANTPELMGLRSRALECLTLIGLSVGKDYFRRDADAVLQILMGIMQQQSRVDDTTMQYTLQAWTRLCQTMKEEFVPYLQHIMPVVMAAAEKKIDMKFLEEDDLEDQQSYKLSSKAFNANLDDKCQAMHMLHSFLLDLKHHLLPYLPKLGTIILPACNFHLSSDVRASAIASLSEMVECAATACKLRQTPLSTVKTVFVASMEMAMKCLNVEKQTELLMALVREVKKSIFLVREWNLNVVDGPMVAVIISSLLAQAERAAKLTMDKETELLTQELDAQACLELETKVNVVRDLTWLITEAVGKVVAWYREVFLPIWQTMAESIWRQLSHKSELARAVAIFFWDDVLEHLGPQVVSNLPQFVPFMLRGTVDESVEIRQACVFGLGIAAKSLGPAFNNISADAVKSLVTCLRHPTSQHNDMITATDNAISALVKILMFAPQAPGVNANELVPIVISCLPIKDDPEESVIVYNWLCEMVQRKNPVVLGEGMCNLPKIFGILVSAVGTRLCQSAELTEKIRQLLATLKQNPQQAQAIVAALPGELQARMQQALTMV